MHADNTGGAPSTGAPPARVWGRWASRMVPSQRRATRRDEAEVDALVLAWERAAEGCGFVRTVQTVTGDTVVIPRVVHIVLGPPTVLTVRLEPGQTVGDLRGLALRLAPHLGAVAMRVEALGIGTHARVTLLAEDPLDVNVPLAAPVVSALDPLTLGVDEDGSPVLLDLATAAHLIVQGASGSGKSVGAYGLLSQLAHAPDVRVAGSDVSGLLLSPWAAHPAGGRQILGTADPAAHVDLLDALVADMDARIAAMPPGRDAVALGPECPVTVVVVEELPGLLRLLDAIDSKIGKRARAALARLLAEGRKAGFRVLLVVQRSDAAIVGAYERGQASHRVSFRVDTADGLRMLHPDVPADVGAAHASAPPGVALLTAPGSPLTRFRAPHLSYADYCAIVRHGASGAVGATS